MAALFYSNFTSQLFLFIFFYSRFIYVHMYVCVCIWCIIFFIFVGTMCYIEVRERWKDLHVDFHLISTTACAWAASPLFIQWNISKHHVQVHCYPDITYHVCMYKIYVYIYIWCISSVYERWSIGIDRRNLCNVCKINDSFERKNKKLLWINLFWFRCLLFLFVCLLVILMLQIWG